jgi:hypothetical protein
VIIARSVWGAKQASLPKRPMTLPANKVFIHHSVTNVTDDPYRDMREIESTGIQRFGQFSYSYCVHPKSGELLEGCGTKRGAHTAGQNSTSFGICWIGNYNDRLPKIQQLDSTRWLIRYLIDQGFLVPLPIIQGHRQAIDPETGRPTATACPGEKLFSVLDAIRFPWEDVVADNPDLPNIEGPLTFHPIADSNGYVTGYYIFSTRTGELHAHGDGNKVRYVGRSEDVTP